VRRSNVYHFLIWYVRVGWRLDHAINFSSVSAYVVKAETLFFIFQSMGEVLLYNGIGINYVMPSLIS